MPCEAVPALANQDGQKLDLPAGVPPLTSLYLYVSGSCNLACRHCWIAPTYQPGGNGGQHLKPEYVRKAIREAKPLGLRSVKLTGGEPTLHPQFRELVTLIDEAGLDITIETNGTLVDDAMARFLKAASHVSFVSVSLDGATAQTHESLRGVAGCYERAIAGIRALVEAGFHPQLICTLHRGNASEMAEVAALAEKLGCGSLKFNHVQKVGRGEQFANEYGLDIAEIIQLYHQVENEIVPCVQVPIHFDIPFAFYSIRRLLKDALSRCSVRNILGMLAGGELSLCGIGVTVPELVYGHLRTDAVRDVWCDSPGLGSLREQVPVQLQGICRQCLHREFCQGECVANNFHITGRLDASYQFCSRAETLGIFPASRTR